MAVMILGPDCFDPSSVGGKAASLSRLRSAGWDVPDWFVVPASVFEEHDAFSTELREAVDAAVEELGGTTFAIRSSAVDEDGGKDSFAGQFLSILDVERSGVLDAILKVRRSGSEESVFAYRSQRGSESRAVPSVIVQRMVHPDAAGVVFTVDPRTGDDDRLLVSAVNGLADDLMAGEVDAWTWSIDRRTGEALLISEGDGSSPLDAGRLSMVRSAALHVEDAQGRPQDIEWTIEGSRLRLVQSRPVTGLPIGRRRVWDNSNIVESYPGWVSPLTFSFARSVYAEVYRRLLSDLGVSRAGIRSREAALQGLLGRFQGRVHYDLGNWHDLLSVLPGYRINAKFMDQMMGVDEPLPPRVKELVDRKNGAPVKIVEWFRLVRAALGLAVSAVKLPMTTRAFRHRLVHALHNPPDWDKAGPDEIVAHWRDLEARLLARWDAPLINDLVCMISVGLARAVLKRWAGDEGLAAFNDALIGQDSIVSAEPPRRIQRMGRMVRSWSKELRDRFAAGDVTVLDECSNGFLEEFDRYLADFGDRCPEELKLESRTVEDDPSGLLRAIASAAGKTSAPLKPRTDASIDHLFADRPIKRRIAGFLLRYSGDRVRDRENLRYNRTQVFGRVRRIVRALGNRLVEAGAIPNADGVFLLTVDELQGHVEGWGVTRDLDGLIRLRAAEADAEMDAVVPDRFETIGPVAGATPISRVLVDHDDADLRIGLGCSPGRISAIARVVVDAKNARVAPGEILVARSTDPGWIALFANAGAVVVEKGSILSHSAIVSREMGIPCVVGIKNVTGWIADGETIEVDGSSGTVRRISA